MISFFLPNPFLTEEFKVKNSPDWSKLMIWNYIRKKYLDLDEDPGEPQGGYERPPEPNLCGPADVKGGIEIPVECYWGPPRHDDVEVSNPWEQYAPQQHGVQQGE